MSTVKKAGSLKELGLALGYPGCCVEHFTAHLMQDLSPAEVVGHGEWAGTGFIPCPSCAETIRKNGFDWFVREHITPNRTDPSVFPEHEPEPWTFAEEFRFFVREHGLLGGIMTVISSRVEEALLNLKLKLSNF